MSVEDDDYTGILLSPQEREAIGWDDDGNEVTDETPDVAAETEEEVDDPVETSEETAKPVEAAETVEEAEADEDEVQPDSEAVQPQPVEALRPEDVAFAPKYEAQVPDNVQERLDTLDAAYEQATDQLATKYEAGDMTFSEYRKAERRLTNEYDSRRDALREAVMEARIATEHSRQSAAQKWQMEQQLFFSDNADYKDDPILRGALSAQLEQLYGDEKNAGKSGLWFLREAAKVIDAKFNRAVAPVAADKAAQAKLKQAEDTLAKRKARHPDAPITLASVPTAEPNEEAGEFKHMDNLSGMEYERELSRMSDAQRERYLAS